MGIGDLLGSDVIADKKTVNKEILYSGKVLIEMVDISWIDGGVSLLVFGNMFKCVIQEERSNLRVWVCNKELPWPGFEYFWHQF